MMIATALVEEVRRMLRGEGRLRNVKSPNDWGSEPRHGQRHRQRKRRDCARRPEHEEDDFIPPAGLPGCPGCGGLTQMPCLACYIRAKNEAKPPARSSLGRRPARGSNAIATAVDNAGRLSIFRDNHAPQRHAAEKLVDDVNRCLFLVANHPGAHDG